MKYKVGSRIVSIEVPKGIWFLEDLSATGKTFMYMLLDQYLRIIKDKILLSTYHDKFGYTITDEEKRAIADKYYDLIFLDRADKYLTPELEDLLMKSDAVVLIDLKDCEKSSILTYDVCFVDFTEKGVRIYD